MASPCRCLLTLLPAVLASALAACDSTLPTEPTPTPCAYALSATTLSFGPGGGETSIGVTTTPGCAWTATADAAWMAIAAGATGQGNGSVRLAAAPNTGSAPRSGTVSVAGHAVAVNQDALPACTYDITPVAATFTSAGGSGTFAVRAPDHCTWTAASPSAWLTITSGNPNTGPGIVSFVVAVNAAPPGRTAVISVAALAFEVAQAGDVAACLYAVSPVEFTPCMASRELAATITTEPSCPWTASADSPWISVTLGESGEGPGTIAFRVGDNWAAPRHGLVRVRWPAATAGQNLTVSQAGCRYAVTRDAFAFSAAGGTGTFDVLQQSDPTSCGGPLQQACLWTAHADAPWVSISSSLPQAGDGRLTFAVAPNGSGQPRSATITIRDKTIRIAQAGG